MSVVLSFMPGAESPDSVERPANIGPGAGDALRIRPAPADNDE